MSDSTPICRCRVLYLGSAVPRQSKDGLQGIQEPLKSLYPSEGAIGAKGIDSWLSVWSNGILLENVDENLKQITRFFPIESLHYCAAVRQVLIPEHDNSNPEPKFLPLDSPFARMPRAQHPPIFAAILRRTTGIKVLECHVFICKREAAANALVRCCFHAYADNSYAKQLENGGATTVYGTLKGYQNHPISDNTTSNSRHHRNQFGLNSWPSASTISLNSDEKAANRRNYNETREQNDNDNYNTDLASGYSFVKNFYGSNIDLNTVADDVDNSICNDENHKIWHSSQDQLNSISVENPYEAFSVNTSTLGRSNRSRQISRPIEVPPPPVKQKPSQAKKKSKRSPKMIESQSLSGTLVRNRPVVVVPRPPSCTPSNMHYGGARHYHTISHRGYPFGGIPSMAQPHTNTIAAQSQINAKPTLGPALQNSMFVQKQYATLQSTRSKKKQNKKNGCIPISMPVIPPMFAYSNGPVIYQQSSPLLNTVPIEAPLMLSNRKLALSVGNALEEYAVSRAESPEGTGIYRRKGHMNERAFSYSIRQEHRSRSHGSLSSLQFNPPDMKKERELAQLVAGLNLNDSVDKSANALLDSKNISSKDSFINGNANGIVASVSNKKYKK